MQDWEIIIELVKALSPSVGAIVSLSLSLGILWKFFSRFTELSDRISKIEGKFENIDKLIHYKVKDELSKIDSKQISKKRQKDENPEDCPVKLKSLVVDTIESISVGFGLLDVSIYILGLIVVPEYRYNLILFFALFVVGFIGLIPIVSSKRVTDFQERAIVSIATMVSALFPWLVLLAA